MEQTMTEKQQNRLIACTLFVFFVSGASSMLMGNLMPFLREQYDISYSRAGFLLSLPSWGNLASIFITGYLPTYIGRRKTVLLTSVWMAIAFVLFNTNRNNIADLVEWKNGRRIDSLVSTLDNLASKLAKAGANLLMTSAMAAMGFDAALPQQPQSALNTICALLGWVPMIVAGIMLVIVTCHPIEKDMAAMRAEQAK